LDPDYWMLIVVTLSWFLAQDVTAEINSVPVPHALNSYAGLLQPQWQQKTWCHLSICMGRLTIHVCPAVAHLLFPSWRNNGI